MNPQKTLDRLSRGMLRNCYTTATFTDNGRGYNAEFCFRKGHKAEFLVTAVGDGWIRVRTRELFHETVFPVGRHSPATMFALLEWAFNITVPAIPSAPLRTPENRLRRIHMVGDVLFYGNDIVEKRAAAVERATKQRAALEQVITGAEKGAAVKLCSVGENGSQVAFTGNWTPESLQAMLDHARTLGVL